MLGKGLGKVLRAASAVMFTTAHARTGFSATASDERTARPVRHHTTGLVGALNAEWRRLSGEPAHRARVVGWGVTVPALAPFADLNSVLGAAMALPDGNVLTALLGLARAGDDLAARTALQASLGAVVRIARRTVGHAGGDLEESLSRAVEAAWRIIRTYPVDRECRPLDGISLDVLAALTGGGRSSHAELPVGLPIELGEPLGDAALDDVSAMREAFWAAVRDRGTSRCADEELIMLLAWAVRVEVITRSEARLLLRLHSPEEPGRAPTCRDVADHLGIAHAAVRQRASRATRRLASAVQALAGSGEPRAA